MLYGQDEYIDQCCMDMMRILISIVWTGCGYLSVLYGQDEDIDQ